MPGNKGKWDLSSFTTPTQQKTSQVGLFQAFGVTPTYMPQLQPELTTGAASNAVPLSQFAPQASTTTGNSSSGSQQSPNAQGLVNPIGKGLAPARVDMGVDYTGAGNLYAIGDGKITNVYNSGWPGGTFIALNLTSGAYKGKTVYYAENIAPKVRVGQSVKAGDLVGVARGTYPYTEIGWAKPGTTGTTMAAATGESAKGQAAGDPGMWSTGYGIAFNNLLKKLGAKPGQLNPPYQGTAPAGY